MLSEKGVRIIRSTLEEHDQLVATTLALPHLMNFAFIETIRKAGLPLDRLRELGGTTFKLQLLIAEALCHESANNEASILQDNPHNVETFSTFAQQIHQVRDIIRRKSQVELLRRLSDDAAYVRGDRLFGRAHERFAAAVEVSSLG
jgi:prephenate dehydrogenase